MASEFERLLRGLWQSENGVLQEIFLNSEGTWTAEVCIDGYARCGIDIGETPEQAILNAVDVAKGERKGALEE